MKAHERRAEILSLIGNSQNPVAANFLSEKYSVSRQVIVQDIAILRAQGYGVISTNRGYVLGSGLRAERVFKCRHTLQELLDESEIIISRGGKVEDISVHHRVYGKISARLELSTMRHAEELYRSLVSGASKPLMSVTDGYHYHTVSGENEQILDEIEAALREKGYLIEI
ncbi:MAG: transcription repressor NadR [Clostridiales bacterium]|nr:transcription repressor NadR [Clostridiales bacterium]